MIERALRKSTSKLGTLLDPAALGVPLTVFISVRTNQHNQQWAENFKHVVEGIPGVLEVVARRPADRQRSALLARSEAQGPGLYTFDVVVTDDGAPNLTDTGTITIDVFEVNQPPVADAGADDTATVGNLVTLDGSGSSDVDIPIQTLTYQWQITSAPAGSTAPSATTVR